MTFVLDNSVALAWCFADERTPAVMALLDRAIQREAVAPSLWPLEAMNTLFVAQRKRRITEAQRKILIYDLSTLPVEIDHGPQDEGKAASRSEIWRPIDILCERYGLTAYDAAYLALALRRRLPLATRDKALIAAAKAADVHLLNTD
jgi:predicted nucleic acid-binding protein